MQGTMLLGMCARGEIVGILLKFSPCSEVRKAEEVQFISFEDFITCM
jgi:hypothetical protein